MKSDTAVFRPCTCVGAWAPTTRMALVMVCLSVSVSALLTYIPSLREGGNREREAPTLVHEWFRSRKGELNSRNSANDNIHSISSRGQRNGSRNIFHLDVVNRIEVWHKHLSNFCRYNLYQVRRCFILSTELQNITTQGKISWSLLPLSNDGWQWEEQARVYDRIQTK